MPTPTDVDFCLTEEELLEAQNMTKEEFVALQEELEQIELSFAQGQETDAIIERADKIEALMDSAPWTLHPDYGCVLKADIPNLDRRTNDNI